MNTQEPAASIEERTLWKKLPVTSWVLLMYLPAIVIGVLILLICLQKDPFTRVSIPYLGPDAIQLYFFMFKFIVVIFYLYLALGLIIAFALDMNRLKKLRKGEPELSLPPTLIVMFIFFGLPQMFPVILAFRQ